MTGDEWSCKKREKKLVGSVPVRKKRRNRAAKRRERKKKSNFCGDHAEIAQVTLVPSQRNYNISRNVPPKFLHPLLCLQKRLLNKIRTEHNESMQ